MGGLPKGTDAQKCLEVLCSEFGWTYQESKGGRAHPVGKLLCSERSRNGCIINVNGTANNTGKKLWTAAKRCTHGCNPDRTHW